MTLSLLHKSTFRVGYVEARLRTESNSVFSLEETLDGTCALLIPWKIDSYLAAVDIEEQLGIFVSITLMVK